MIGSAVMAPDSMSRMMNDTDTWFELYGSLIDKHRHEFAESLIDLLLRREWSIARLCRGIDGAREELTTILEPAVHGRLEELAAARTKLRDQQALAELPALRTRAEWLEATTQHLGQRVTDLRAQALNLERDKTEAQRHTTNLERDNETLKHRTGSLDVHTTNLERQTRELNARYAAQQDELATRAREQRRANEDITKLRDSLSWRITSPLRRIYEWLGMK